MIGQHRRARGRERRAEGAATRPRARKTPCPTTIVVLSTMTEARPSSSGTHAPQEIGLDRLAAHRRGRRGRCSPPRRRAARPEPGEGRGRRRKRSRQAERVQRGGERVGEAEHEDQPPRERARRRPDRGGADLPDHVSHDADAGDQQRAGPNRATAGPPSASCGTAPPGWPPPGAPARRCGQAREPVALRARSPRPPRAAAGATGRRRAARRTRGRAQDVEEVAVAHVPEGAAQRWAHLDLPRELAREERAEGHAGRGRRRPTPAMTAAARGRRPWPSTSPAWMTVSTSQSRCAPRRDSWNVSRAISPSEWSTMHASA